MRNKALARLMLLGVLWGLTGCTGVPEGIAPVTHFDAQRYSGQWYEIARLDHAFERGLTQVTATYGLRDDGGVWVRNRGLDVDTGQWQSAEGRAYLVAAPHVGHLKVSFFGPFYGSYLIFHLDAAFQYAFVTSYTRDFLWLLARTPTVSPALKQQFIEQAAALGFNVDAVFWVPQTAN